MARIRPTTRTERSPEIVRGLSSSEIHNELVAVQREESSRLGCNKNCAQCSNTDCKIQKIVSASPGLLNIATTAAAKGSIFNTEKIENFSISAEEERLKRGCQDGCAQCTDQTCKIKKVAQASPGLVQKILEKVDKDERTTSGKITSFNPGNATITLPAEEKGKQAQGGEMKEEVIEANDQNVESEDVRAEQKKTVDKDLEDIIESSDKARSSSSFENDSNAVISQIAEEFKFEPFSQQKGADDLNQLSKLIESASVQLPDSQNLLAELHRQIQLQQQQTSQQSQSDIAALSQQQAKAIEESQLQAQTQIQTQIQSEIKSVSQQQQQTFTQAEQLQRQQQEQQRQQSEIQVQSDNANERARVQAGEIARQQAQELAQQQTLAGRLAQSEASARQQNNSAAELATTKEINSIAEMTRQKTAAETFNGNQIAVGADAAELGLQKRKEISASGFSDQAAAFSESIATVKSPVQEKLSAAADVSEAVRLAIEEEKAASSAGVKFSTARPVGRNKSQEVKPEAEQSVALTAKDLAVAQMKEQRSAGKKTSVEKAEAKKPQLDTSRLERSARPAAEKVARATLSIETKSKQSAKAEPKQERGTQSPTKKLLTQLTAKVKESAVAQAVTSNKSVLEKQLGRLEQRTLARINRGVSEIISQSAEPAKPVLTKAQEKSVQKMLTATLARESRAASMDRPVSSIKVKAAAIKELSAQLNKSISVKGQPSTAQQRVLVERLVKNFRQETSQLRAEQKRAQEKGEVLLKGQLARVARPSEATIRKGAASTTAEVKQSSAAAAIRESKVLAATLRSVIGRNSTETGTSAAKFIQSLQAAKTKNSQSMIIGKLERSIRPGSLPDVISDSQKSAVGKVLATTQTTDRISQLIRKTSAAARNGSQSQQADLKAGSTVKSQPEIRAAISDLLKGPKTVTGRTSNSKNVQEITAVLERVSRSSATQKKFAQAGSDLSGVLKQKSEVASQLGQTLSSLSAKEQKAVNNLLQLHADNRLSDAKLDKYLSKEIKAKDSGAVVKTVGDLIKQNSALKGQEDLIAAVNPDVAQVLKELKSAAEQSVDTQANSRGKNVHNAAAKAEYLTASFDRVSSVLDQKPTETTAELMSGLSKLIAVKGSAESANPADTEQIKALSPEELLKSVSTSNDPEIKDLQTKLLNRLLTEKNEELLSAIVAQTDQSDQETAPTAIVDIISEIDQYLAVAAETKADVDTEAQTEIVNFAKEVLAVVAESSAEVVAKQAELDLHKQLSELLAAEISLSPESSVEQSVETVTQEIISVLNDNEIELQDIVSGLITEADLAELSLAPESTRALLDLVAEQQGQQQIVSEYQDSVAEILADADPELAELILNSVDSTGADLSLAEVVSVTDEQLLSIMAVEGLSDEVKLGILALHEGLQEDLQISAGTVSLDLSLESAAGVFLGDAEPQQALEQTLADFEILGGLTEDNLSQEQLVEALLSYEGTEVDTELDAELLARLQAEAIAALLAIKHQELLAVTEADISLETIESAPLAIADIMAEIDSYLQQAAQTDTELDLAATEITLEQSALLLETLELAKAVSEQIQLPSELTSELITKENLAVIQEAIGAEAELVPEVLSELRLSAELSPGQQAEIAQAIENFVVLNKEAVDLQVAEPIAEALIVDGEDLTAELVLNFDAEQILDTQIEKPDLTRELKLELADKKQEAAESAAVVQSKEIIQLNHTIAVFNALTNNSAGELSQAQAIETLLSFTTSDLADEALAEAVLELQKSAVAQILEDRSTELNDLIAEITKEARLMTVPVAIADLIAEIDRHLLYAVENDVDLDLMPAEETLSLATEILEEISTDSSVQKQLAEAALAEAVEQAMQETGIDTAILNQFVIDNITAISSAVVGAKRTAEIIIPDDLSEAEQQLLKTQFLAVVAQQKQEQSVIGEYQEAVAAILANEQETADLIAELSVAGSLPITLELIGEQLLVIAEDTDLRSEIKLDIVGLHEALIAELVELATEVSDPDSDLAEVSPAASQKDLQSEVQTAPVLEARPPGSAGQTATELLEDFSVDLMLMTEAQNVPVSVRRQLLKAGIKLQNLADPQERLCSLLSVGEDLALEPAAEQALENLKKDCVYAFQKLILQQGRAASKSAAARQGAVESAPMAMADVIAEIDQSALNREGRPQQLVRDSGSDDFLRIPGQKVALKSPAESAATLNLDDQLLELIAQAKPPGNSALGAEQETIVDLSVAEEPQEATLGGLTENDQVLLNLLSRQEDAPQDASNTLHQRVEVEMPTPVLPAKVEAPYLSGEVLELIKTLLSSDRDNALETANLLELLATKDQGLIHTARLLNLTNPGSAESMTRLAKIAGLPNDLVIKKKSIDLIASCKKMTERAEEFELDDYLLMITLLKSSAVKRTRSFFDLLDSEKKDLIGFFADISENSFSTMPADQISKLLVSIKELAKLKLSANIRRDFKTLTSQDAASYN